MSTKSTIKSGHNYHLFKEMLDDDNIYLTIHNPGLLKIEEYRNAAYITVVTICVTKEMARELNLI